MDIAYYKSLEPFWGSWYIDDLIGEGAFGKVFRIKREDYSTYEAAMKVVSIPQSEGEWKSALSDGMDQESVTQYFEGYVKELSGEIALMSSLKGHSNIVSYEDHSVIRKKDGHGWDIFIRMELLKPLLSELDDTSSMPALAVIKLGIDLCSALEVCNREHMIHRDIKPENIFISRYGGYKLGDFGIARKIEQTTGALSKKGTYTYMAPEVYKEQEYDATVDIYSLGIVMYKLLNRNRPPFYPNYPEVKVVQYNDREEAMRLRMTGAKLPYPRDAVNVLGDVILKACAYQPKERYSSAREMKEALQHLYEHPDLLETSVKEEHRVNGMADDTPEWKENNPEDDSTMGVLPPKNAGGSQKVYAQAENTANSATERVSYVSQDMEPDSTGKTVGVYNGIPEYMLRKEAEPQKTVEPVITHSSMGAETIAEGDNTDNTVGIYAGIPPKTNPAEQKKTAESGKEVYPQEANRFAPDSNMNQTVYGPPKNLAVSGGGKVNTTPPPYRPAAAMPQAAPPVTSAAASVPRAANPVSPVAAPVPAAPVTAAPAAANPVMRGNLMQRLVWLSPNPQTQKKQTTIRAIVDGITIVLGVIPMVAGMLTSFLFVFLFGLRFAVLGLIIHGIVKYIFRKENYKIWSANLMKQQLQEDIRMSAETAARVYWICPCPKAKRDILRINPAAEGELRNKGKYKQKPRK